jgi:Arc/MetJ-type ribon-helix-helix transcriptional regulator
MPTTKVAVTLDSRLLAEVDRWVAAGEFPNRSRAVQSALEQVRQARAKRPSLLQELAKLNAAEEQDLAEERLVGEVPWPRY